MHGSSRAAVAKGQAALDAALAPDADWNVLAEDLFGILGAIDRSATLRRALADPSRDGDAKRDLAARLFGGKVGVAATSVITSLAAQRWSADRDLADTVESLAVQTVLAEAERGGRSDAVEDELFRFERIVAGNPELREVLSHRNADASGKAGVVTRLLEGKAAPETLRLAQQAVSAPRGRRLERTLETYLSLAAGRRDQLTAVVTSAAQLTDQQQARLASALEGVYGKAINLQAVIDPDVMGGLYVQIGDEVVDGTILRRVDEARRHLSGG
ncbi:MAG: F0F1 ATP synthase subunit delta [Nostocoides sp.]